MDGRREYAAQPAPSQVARATVVIGRWWRLPRPRPGQSSGDPTATVAAAFDQVPAELRILSADLRRRGLFDAAQIVEANGEIARDPDLRVFVDAAVAGGAEPATAMLEAAEHFAGVLASLDDPTLAARATDVRAVGHRLAAATTSTATIEATATGPRILAGWELTADDLLSGGPSVVGAVTVVGGSTAHVGIVARSLGVPIVFGADPAVLKLPDYAEVFLDTRLGRVVVNPSSRQRLAAAADAAAVDARRRALANVRSSPLTASDGEPVLVLANVASVAEAELADSMGAPGVGLLRTEMPFLNAVRWPTFEEHLDVLSATLAPLAGRPATVRTLDFADDKLPPFLRSGRTGPLGPGLALMLDEPEAAEVQIRAILAAGRERNIGVSIMFPMVDSVATLKRCRDLVISAAATLGVVPPPVGAMIELPEAVRVVDGLAQAADFLSIGTNDLTAGILGLGRRDPNLTPSRLREPAVLDAVERVVRAGRAAARPVSVCGDAASDPTLVPDLLRLGCRILSVAPSMMDEIRLAVAGASETVV